MHISIRRPVFAGSFYSNDPDELRTELQNCFLHKFGPGKIPLRKPPERPSLKRQFISVVCPHAGYTYSGPVASNAYYRLSEEPSPEVVIVIGPNHQGFGSPVALVSKGEWVTPLGRVKIDEDFAQRLLKASGFIDSDDQAHRSEHSVEVQLPFLQYIYGSDFKLIPICMGFQDLETSRKMGQDLADIIGETDVVLVASSDLSHYVPQKTAERLDRMVIDAVLHLDEEELQSRVLSNRITTCGYGPVSTILVASKILGANRAELLSYRTSGDTTGDYSSVVGYSSIVISR